jgi:hypothetical protein
MTLSLEYKLIEFYNHQASGLLCVSCVCETRLHVLRNGIQPSYVIQTFDRCSLEGVTGDKVKWLVSGHALLSSV